MLHLGLSAADRRALNTALITTGDVNVQVELLTLGDDGLGSLNDYLLDGQVNVDNTQPITRQLTMALIDNKRQLPFDTDSPATTALFMDRMIRVRYGVVLNGSMFHIPVFTGPVTGLSRAGSTVNVTAQSKEVFSFGAQAWTPYTIPKGTKKTDAITRILSKTGEDNNHLVIPDLAARLPTHMSLYRSSLPWAKALSIARGMNRQLYYSADGYCRLRTHPGLVYTFDDEHHIVGDPQITYGGATANCVMIVGAIPKGHKTPITSIAVAPANHPLSPQRLGRNGVPRHIMLTGQPISIPSIKTQKECDAVANQRLNDALKQQVDVQFDVIPGAVALLDHGDLCHMNNDLGVVAFRLGKFSLPLRDGGMASVGYHNNVSIRKARRRTHHKSRKHPAK